MTTQKHIQTKHGQIIVIHNQAEKSPANLSNKVNERNSQRRSVRTLHGTAQDQIVNGKAPAADIDLVVSGVAKDVTAIQVSQFIEAKGIKVLDCVLLTKYEQARTLSYKITIKARDYGKSQNLSMWPYRVRVRVF